MGILILLALFFITVAALDRILDGKCPKCSGRMVHRWHTSSKEIDECEDCGYIRG